MKIKKASCAKRFYRFYATNINETHKELTKLTLNGAIIKKISALIKRRIPLKRNLRIESETTIKSTFCAS